MNNKWTQEKLDKLIVGASTVYVAKGQLGRRDRLSLYHPFVFIKGRTERAKIAKLRELVLDPYIMRGDCEGCELIDYGRF